MNSSEKAQNFTILPGNGSSDITAKEWPTFHSLYRNYLKRCLDLCLFLIILPFALPLILFLMLLIKLNSKGPAIYKNERIGKNGEKFNCLKLRTMYEDADEKLKKLLDENEFLKREFERDHKLKNDPRITSIGKFLRISSLDELPQIFNVLKGEMSFVGPRPIVKAEISKYGKQFRYYESILPGITGVWQVNGRNDTSYEERVAMDSSYAQNSNLPLDLKILFQTIPAALSKKGAY